MRKLPNVSRLLPLHQWKKGNCPSFFIKQPLRNTVFMLFPFLKIASAQFVETSVKNNSPSQDSNHPDHFLIKELFQVVHFSLLLFINSLIRRKARHENTQKTPTYLCQVAFPACLPRTLHQKHCTCCCPRKCFQLRQRY